MEIFAYFIIYISTLILIIFPTNHNKWYFKFIWFSVAFFYSLSIRLDITSVINGDLPNYIRIMKLDDLGFNLPLFQREFIFYNFLKIINQ